MVCMCEILKFFFFAILRRILQIFSNFVQNCNIGSKIDEFENLVLLGGNDSKFPFSTSYFQLLRFYGHLMVSNHIRGIICNDRASVKAMLIQ